MPKIFLTRISAEVVEDLKSSFTSGVQSDGGFRPQTRSIANALIAHCKLNNHHRKETFPKDLSAEPTFSPASVTIKDNGDQHSFLNAVAELCGLGNEERKLEHAFERIVSFYQNTCSQREIRGIVKPYVLRESFRKSKDRIAIDVPLDVWEKFETEREDKSEPSVLHAMEKHIKELCGNPADIRALLNASKAQITFLRAGLDSMPVKFAALAVEKSAKKILTSSIHENFEASVVAILESRQGR